MLKYEDLFEEERASACKEFLAAVDNWLKGIITKALLKSLEESFEETNKRGRVSGYVILILAITLNWNI